MAYDADVANEEVPVKFPKTDPVNEPVKDPVLYELLNDKKLLLNNSIDALLVVILVANEELSVK